MMNEPLINPWIFYIADVCQSLNIILLIILTCIFGFCIGFVLDNRFEFLKQTAIILAIGVFIFILIPSRDTIYKIAIAKQITPANIQKAGDSIDVVIDRAIEKIQRIRINTNPK